MAINFISFVTMLKVTIMHAIKTNLANLKKNLILLEELIHAFSAMVIIIH